MRIIRGIAFMVMVLGACTTFGQNQCYYLNKFNHQVWDDAGDRFLMNSDGDLVVLGRGFTQTTDVIWLLWMDDCGDTLNTRTYELSAGSGGEEGVAIFQNNDRSYTILGNQYDPNQSTSSSFVFNVSETGDSLSHYIVDVGQNDWTIDAVRVSDGNFVCTGFYNVGNVGTVFLYSIDTSGTIGWLKDYARPLYHDVMDMKRTLDGGFIITGLTVDASRQDYDYFLIKTDSLGNLEWRETYPTLYWEGNGNVAVLRDGGYLIAGSIGIPMNFTEVGYPETIRVDAFGNKLWSRIYDNDSIEKGFLLTEELPSGELVSFGARKDTITAATNLTIGYLVITKMTATGDILWERDIRYNLPEVLHFPRDFQILANGDFLCAGTLFTFYPSSTTRNDLMIVRTDSCGYTVGDTTIAAITLDSIYGYQAWFENSSTKACSSTWYFGDGDSSQTNNPSHLYPDTGSYTVMLITTAGHTADTTTITVHIPVPVGLSSQFTTRPIKVYPNPTNGYITIEVPNNEEHTFTLYNLLGERLMETATKGSTATLKVEQPSGLYLYRITARDGSALSGKLVVE